jgi:hypothetical protein
MRVLHLTHSDAAGGAARAAHRIHTALGAAGVQSEMLVADKGTADPSVDAVARSRGRAGGRSPVASMLRSSDACGRPDPRPLAEPPSERHAPHREPDRRGRRPPALGQPRVARHRGDRAHRAATGVDAPRRVAVLGARALPDGRRCPRGWRGRLAVWQERALRTWKRLAWRRAGILVVAPSIWVAERCAASGVFATGTPAVIPHPLDRTVFRPADRRACRRRLGLPESPALLLFGAQHGDDPRKGWEERRTHLEPTLRALGSGSRRDRG